MLSLSGMGNEKVEPLYGEDLRVSTVGCRRKDGAVYSGLLPVTYVKEFRSIQLKKN